MPDPASRIELSNQRALVTGASRGLGAEIAAVFADAGADLVLTGRDAAGLEATRKVVESKGRRCLCIEADLRSVEGPSEIGRKALEFLGTVDILVNNAGIVFVEDLLGITPEHWEETMNVNLRAPLLLAQTVVPRMIDQRRGKVINISSMAGVLVPEGHGAYSASKGGFNIQANAVAPTVILTEMGQQVWGDPLKGDPMKARIPARRFGEPVEVADLVLFLASPASDFLCGQVIRLDGGLSAV
jgi:2-deoxy-D-gluconate 3-dehydrogenase